MMEFLTSRTALMVCGAMMLAAVAVPLGEMFDSEKDVSLDRVASSAASTIELFAGSGMDEMYIRGSEILPGPSDYITAEGNILTLHSGGSEHISVMSCRTEGITITYGETITLVMDGDTVTCRRTCPRPSRGRRRTCRCPRGCCRGIQKRGRCRGCRGNRNRSGRSASRSGS